MTTTTMKRIKAVGALAPLAVLSMGWTTTLVAPSVPAVVAGVTPAPPVVDLPDVGVELPAPASGTRPSLASRGGELLGVSIVQAVSTHGIPFSALAAYQRAAAVMDAADSACHLPWQLLAAIGRVESDHGRYGASDLDTEGVAHPPIIGIPLNGKRNTSAISDTDAGLLDGDVKWDRAVGPMQFIPSTWSVVGVDADGDGRRDPQDIDDAALGAAVYLCAGDGDLGTVAGREAALLRYNHSVDYVRLVLSIFAAYSQGVPVSAMPAVMQFDAGSMVTPRAPGGQGWGPDSPDKPTPTPAAIESPASQQPETDPTDPAPPTDPLPDECVAPEEPTEEPVPDPTEEPAPDPTEEPAPDPTEEPAPDPTEAPAPDPTDETTIEPAPDPTEEPAPEPTCSTPGEPAPEPDPGGDPELTGDPDPASEPSGEPSGDPAGEPAGEPTPEPEPAVVPEPVVVPDPEPAPEPGTLPEPETTTEPAADATTEPSGEPTP
jgi:hypothetical protein